MFNSTILGETSHWILPTRLRSLISCPCLQLAVLFLFFPPCVRPLSPFLRPEWRNLRFQHVSLLVASILPRSLRVVVVRDREFYETLKLERRNLSCDTGNGVQFASRVVAALVHCLLRIIFTAVFFSNPSSSPRDVNIHIPQQWYTCNLIAYKNEIFHNKL